jgi:uncharacterized protein
MHALITGASSGFGAELSRLFAARGHSLVLVARNQERLAELARELQTKHSIQVKILPKDLSQPAAPSEILQELEREQIAISILVNNAGFALHGSFAALDLRQQLDMIEVNVRTLVELTARILPQMLQRGQGRILNLASTGAYQPGPFLAVYFATKAFVHSFSVALAEEVRDSGITVTTLCPGPSHTGFKARAGLHASGLFSGRLLPMMEVPAVAQAGYDGLMRGKRVVIPGWVNWFGAFLAKCSPSFFSAKVIRKLNHSP